METWMSRIPDNKKLKFINIPATHDSCAYYMNRISFSLAKTQYYSITKQLEIGTRKLDLRFTDSGKNKDKDEDLICCHGICDCYENKNCFSLKKLTFKSVLIEIKTFLEKYPSETVMIAVQLGRGNNGEVLKRSFEIINKYVGDIMINYHSDLTLGEVRGKIINLTVLQEEIDKKEINKKIITSFNNIKGTGIDEVHFKYRNYATFKVNGILKIQELKDMFKLYNLTIEQAESEEYNNKIKFPIEYSISCTGEKDACLPNPFDQAKIVHNFIQKDGIFKKGYYYGWLKMDFANPTSNFKLIDTNFIN